MTVPIISTVIGEGGSGGALALGVANRVLVLEFSYYSVITPEGCAAILWKSGDLAPEAAARLKITAPNLLELGITWKAVDDSKEIYEGRDASGQVRWTGSRADLVFGSNSELRALAEVYASDDAREKFVHDFVDAWVTVMENDRFDLHR